MEFAKEDKQLIENTQAGVRITPAQAVHLWSLPVAVMGMLATAAKERVSGKNVYYNRNFHVEPTNLCLFRCKFCSYRRDAGSAGAWDYTPEEIISQVESRRDGGATEIHIVGGVHPSHDLYYYVDLIRRIKGTMPAAVVKAFTAVELRYMIEKAGLGLREGLLLLKEAGMEAIPGGGAEIFDEALRNRICPEKGSAQEWLEVHAEAHGLGIPTNATILYGHVETLAQRIDHLERLRRQQDLSGGFNAFIPLKYRSEGNSMGSIGEVSIVEDMKMMALARIYLDNIPHIKAYWPMFGKTTAQIALAFGADDMDGTIEDSTKIYSMAGAEERAPSMDIAAMEKMIRSAGYVPVERDTFYNKLR